MHSHVSAINIHQASVSANSLLMIKIGGLAHVGVPSRKGVLTAA